jgi:hypothetical protein
MLVQTFGRLRQEAQDRRGVRFERVEAVGYGAGWHAHLDALERFLVGESVDWDERFGELRRSSGGSGWAPTKQDIVADMPVAR